MDEVAKAAVRKWEGGGIGYGADDDSPPARPTGREEKESSAEESPPKTDLDKIHRRLRHGEDPY